MYLVCRREARPDYLRMCICTMVFMSTTTGVSKITQNFSLNEFQPTLTIMMSECRPRLARMFESTTLSDHQGRKRTWCSDVDVKLFGFFLLVFYPDVIHAKILSIHLYASLWPVLISYAPGVLCFHVWSNVALMPPKLCFSSASMETLNLSFGINLIIVTIFIGAAINLHCFCWRILLFSLYWFVKFFVKNLSYHLNSVFVSVVSALTKKGAGLYYIIDKVVSVLQPRFFFLLVAVFHLLDSQWCTKKNNGAELTSPFYAYLWFIVWG